jgi:hypothetical protein
VDRQPWSCGSGAHLEDEIEAGSVMFGSNPATGFTVVSSTSMTAVVPAGTAGTVDVRVTVPAGGVTRPITAADQFTYKG